MKFGEFKNERTTGLGQKRELASDRFQVTKFCLEAYFCCQTFDLNGVPKARPLERRVRPHWRVGKRLLLAGY